MNGRVLLTEEIDPKGKAVLLQHGLQIKMGTGLTEEALCRDAADCQGILTRNGVITEKVMRSAPDLQVIAMHGVGVDNIDVESASRLGIQVTNAATSNQNSVAEYTMGLILTLSRHIVMYHRELQMGNWNIRKTFGMDLEGKTLGIVGIGRIGSLVAQKASAGFGMHVIAYKRSAKETGIENGILTTCDLAMVLRSADFLSLHIPLSPQTRGMIGEKELALMKPGAYLINTARGEVVDTQALRKALLEKKLAGAAIDVFDGGTPDSNEPLLHMENVIVSPHAAAFTRQSLERMAVQAATGIVEVLSGLAPTYPVNHPAVHKHDPSFIDGGKSA